jgi:hypothetical protein
LYYIILFVFVLRKRTNLILYYIISYCLLLLYWVHYTITITITTTILLGFFEEPIFQLGLTAQAAEAAAEKGVQYYSAAGNTFDNSYETIYKGIPCPPEFEDLGFYTSCLDFGNGNPRQFLDASQGGNVTIQWDQPWMSVSGMFMYVCMYVCVRFYVYVCAQYVCVYVCIKNIKKNQRKSSLFLLFLLSLTSTHTHNHFIL